MVKDSRVAEADNEQFLDLMEDYFNLPDEELKYACKYPANSRLIEQHLHWTLLLLKTRRAAGSRISSWSDAGEHGEAKVQVGRILPKHYQAVRTIGAPVRC